MRAERKHSLSTGYISVSAYIGKSKNLQDLKGLRTSNSHSLNHPDGT
jgi:hypothetical protein